MEIARQSKRKLELEVTGAEKWMMDQPKQVMAGTLATIAVGSLLFGFAIFRDRRSQPVLPSTADARTSIAATIPKTAAAPVNENRPVQATPPINLAAVK